MFVDGLRDDGERGREHGHQGLAVIVDDGRRRLVRRLDSKDERPRGRDAEAGQEGQVAADSHAQVAKHDGRRGHGHDAAGLVRLVVAEQDVALALCFLGLRKKA